MFRFLFNLYSISGCFIFMLYQTITTTNKISLDSNFLILIFTVVIFTIQQFPCFKLSGLVRKFIKVKPIIALLDQVHISVKRHSLNLICKDHWVFYLCKNQYLSFEGSLYVRGSLCFVREFVIKHLKSAIWHCY